MSVPARDLHGNRWLREGGIPGIREVRVHLQIFLDPVREEPPPSARAAEFCQDGATMKKDRKERGITADRTERPGTKNFFREYWEIVPE